MFVEIILYIVISINYIALLFYNVIRKNMKN